MTRAADPALFSSRVDESPQGATHLYGRYCRPRVASFLEAVGLDVEYVRAEGSVLYYHSDKGRLVPVIDFLGGYGSLLFGHNHPSLVGVAMDALKQQAPFGAQASCRGAAARLAARLSQMFRVRFGHDFVTTFASSGAEAVEAAMKHAVFSRKRRLEALAVECRRDMAALRRGVAEGRYRPGAGCSIDETLADAEASLSELLASRAIFISVEGAFHGKTTGATALCHYEGYRDDFRSMLPDVLFVTPDDIASIDRVVAAARASVLWPHVDTAGTISLATREISAVAAFFVEPIQGEGGIRVMSRSFLRRAREVADREEFPLVFDEIQCGMGRTGTFLFSEQQGVAADYYTLSKSLGGGIAKVSAFLVRSDLYEEDFGLIQTSTFAEDDLGATISLAALELLESGELMALCAKQGALLLSGLHILRSSFPDVIREVRGVGLMLGVELERRETSDSPAIAALSAQDVLGYAIAGYLLKAHGLRVAPCLSNAHVLRIEPSAFVTPAQCEALLAGLRRVAEILRDGDIHALTRHVVGSPLARTIHGGLRSPRFATGAAIGPHVGFIGYFVDAGGLAEWDHGYSRFEPHQLDLLVGRTWRALDPAKIGRWVVPAANGAMVTLTVYGIAIDSKHFAERLRLGDTKLLRRKVEAAVTEAKADGCSLVGFGGFTSILTDNCRAVATLGIGLTTGNSLTVGMGVEALFAAAAKAAVAEDMATFAAIGAHGNIGTVFCELVAERVPRLVLVSRPGREHQLKPLATRIYARALDRLRQGDAAGGIAAAIRDTAAVRGLRGEPSSRRDGEFLLTALNRDLGGAAPLVVTSDRARLREASLLVGASNAVEPLIGPEHIGSGPVVICDLAVPSDVSLQVRELSNVTFVNGGTVRLPASPDFRAVGSPLPPGHVYACMAETLVLGMERRFEDFTVGAVTRNKVAEIVRLAKALGFQPAAGDQEAPKALLKVW